MGRYARIWAKNRLKLHKEEFSDVVPKEWQFCSFAAKAHEEEFSSEGPKNGPLCRITTKTHSKRNRKNFGA